MYFQIIFWLLLFNFFPHFINRHEHTLYVYTHCMYTHTLYVYTHCMYTHTVCIHTHCMYTHTVCIHTHCMYTHTVCIHGQHSRATFSTGSNTTCVLLKSSLFSECTQHWLVVNYRRFGTAYRSHLHRSSSLDCLTLDQSTLPKIKKERTRHLHRAVA
jgi:hypothetical protein